jgi:hypothetical protein
MKSLHLLYHELRPIPTSYTYVLDSSEFDSHCELFARLRASAGEALRPEVTFDDGHRSGCEIALPILHRHGINALFFLTVGWIGQHPDYMSWEQVRALRDYGQTIGAHGWTHSLLTHCSPLELHRELAGARMRLEDELSAPVTLMSLPGGRSNHRVLEACWNAGYTEVFTSCPRAEPAVLPSRSTVGRLNVRSSMTSDFLEQVLRPESGLLAKLERQENLKSTTRSLLGDKLYAKLWALLNRKEAQSDAAGVSSQ